MHHTYCVMYVQLTASELNIGVLYLPTTTYMYIFSTNFLYLHPQTLLFCIVCVFCYANIQLWNTLEISCCKQLKKNPCYTYTNCELEIICYPCSSFNVLFEYSKGTVCNKPLM